MEYCLPVWCSRDVWACLAGSGKSGTGRSNDLVSLLSHEPTSCSHCPVFTFYGFFSTCLFSKIILYIVLAVLHSRWDLSSLTGDWTQTPAADARSLSPWTAREVPTFLIQSQESITWSTHNQVSCFLARFRINRTCSYLSVPHLFQHNVWPCFDPQWLKT